jgi:hypothetical protein
MKIEQLLVQHFYQNGEVTLQGMGTFTLSPDFVAPKENDKDAELPENAISFQYNSRAVEDDALINFIVQQTRKMKALAAADLDSYLVLGKQFLNIGKPFKIEGMGMLSKNQKGALEFQIGKSFHAKSEPIPANLKEKAANPEISFASETKSAVNNNIKALLIGGIIIALGLMGTTVWYFFIRKTSPVENTVVKLSTDTAKAIVPKPDTVALPVPPVKPVVAADGYTFKVLFLETKDSVAAAYRMNVLTKRGHKIIMNKIDSAIYTLAEPFTLPLSDTTHVKDSLNSFYYLGKGRIQL